PLRAHPTEHGAMRFSRFLRRALPQRGTRHVSLSHKRRPKDGLALRLERLEDRLAPALLGLANHPLVKPDIASGATTSITYKHEGDGTNPFHYQASALSLTLGDGVRHPIAKPTPSGVARTTLDLQLDN